MKKTKKEVKKKTNFIQKAVKSRGFYIAVASLAVIVGFTVYARRMQVDLQSQVASFDDEAWKEAVEDSGFQIVNVDDAVEAPKLEPEKETVEATPKAESPETAVPTSAKPEQRTEVPKFSIQLPCSGPVVAECSVDELVYCDTMDDWRTHNGMDIAAALGDQVKAAATGVVSKVYTDDLLGVVVVLDHGDGISSLYGNLQSADFIKTGTEVKAGDIIGGVGEPGALEAKTEPHLHFELIKNGEYKNPKEYLN
ncbi:MAG: hypothetical protein E7401_05570 [Ruminococcaceae bacterium]|nr:hypothetical protein [Oscillospiraceae bacterium]